MSLRCRLLSAVIVAAVTAAACGDPPDKEIQQAQGAIDAAKAAGADLYARDELADGDSTVQKARAAFDRADYSAAGDIIAGTTTRLLATARDLETAAVSGARRRR